MPHEHSQAHTHEHDHEHDKKPGKFKRFIRRYKIALLAATPGIIILSLMPFFTGGGDEEPTPLTNIIAHISDGEVAEATLDENTRSVTVVLDDEDSTEVTSTYTALWADSLTDALLDADIDVDIVPIKGTSWLMNTLGTMLPLILIFGVLIFILRGALKIGLSDIGDRSDIPETRFSDIAGVDEAVEEMRELVQFLREGDRFEQMGARTPRGALFVGPPGTGKTLLARAVAGESGVPFFHVNGSDFVELFAGRGPARVRSLFKKAKEHGKAIIFIDEIDSVGRERGSESPSGGTMESENTLTALLTEMDGFERSDVIVIAATNRLDVLDPALRRRLEHVIQVPLPDRRGRSRILQIHAAGKPFVEGTDWDEVGRQAYGMSGADLERVVNEACMDAVRRKSGTVGGDNLLRALSTIQVGRERLSAALTDRDKEITAWHEAGHAVACALAENLSDPTFVTIVPRGESGGHTRPGGTDDQFRTRDQMFDELVMAMGGRVGEELLLGRGNYTQGASGDLAHATTLATAMVSQYGMGDRLIQTDPDMMRLGAEVSAGVREEVNGFIRSAYEVALMDLTKHRRFMERMSAALLEDETLSGERLAEVVREGRALAEKKGRADTLPRTDRREEADQK